MVRSLLQKALPACNLAAFRILFGLIMVWEAWRYWSLGRIESYFIEAPVTFPYEFLPFVRPLEGDGMYIVFALWALSALTMALGLFTRFSAGLLFVLYTYVFLIDKSYYNNHYYLICLLLFLMLFIPSERCWSIDRWRSKEMPGAVPAWSLYLLQFQWIVVYFYAGVAKLNPDWLVGEPLAHRLYKHGGVFVHVETHYLFAYGGLIFDLFVGPMLIWKPTRTIALVACLAFHVTNAFQLSIGIFPYLGIAALVLFIEPSWLAKLTRTETELSRTFTMGKVVSASLCLWVAVQILVPLRHWLYPGNVAWTERGHRFAWRMKLRSKKGELKFFAITPGGDLRHPLNVDSLIQKRQFRAMRHRPDMILQFVESLPHPESWQIVVDSRMSLNYRKSQTFIKPDVDLRTASISLVGPVEWLEPLSAPPNPVPLKLEQGRRMLAFILTLLCLMLGWRVLKGKQRVLALSCLLVGMAWPAGVSGAVSVLLSSVALVLCGHRQFRAPGLAGGWFLLLGSILLTVSFTALIAPYT